MFDYIIVGGGSAGCVLANRLSAKLQNNVLLIEAGYDTPPDNVPAAVLDSYPRIAYFDPRNLWGDLRAHTYMRSGNKPDTEPTSRYEQARLMGGGSSINDMQANRGLPSDYDEWDALGAKGWSWSDVLPYFIKLENDLDFNTPMHGSNGPIPIRRISPDIWPGFTNAAKSAFDAAGYQNIEDQNGIFGTGYFPIAINNIDDHRVSTAMAYLDRETRSRPNLSIMANSQVLGIEMDGNCAVGVKITNKSGEQIIGGKEVILSTGAIHSPAMLMRAGIGPAYDLQNLGIPVLFANEAVGANLCEHPAISISGYMRSSARLSKYLKRHSLLGLRYSSGIDECTENDMYLIASAKTGWHSVGQRIGSMLVWVNKSYSRGQVSLYSKAPNREPRVELNIASDPRDVARLVDGFRKIASFYSHQTFDGVVDALFPTAYNERLRKVSEVNTKNRLTMALLAGLLDGPSWFREWLVATIVSDGSDVAELLADDNALVEFIARNAHGLWHVSGTCRMGPSANENSVVDTHGCVHGCSGLRVVDASIMPNLPCANTNIPTIMMAEKISDSILSGS